MKYIRIIMVLFIFLFVGGCNNSNNKAEIIAGVDESGLSVKNYEKEEVLKSNIMITNSNYHTFLGFKLREHNKYGSGFIYSEDENSYYALTNYHVINRDDSYNHSELVVEDYFGSKIKANIIKISKEFDLAIISFEKVDNLNVLSLSHENILVNEHLKSMGNPSSIRNVISDGVATCYSDVDVSDGYDLDFDVVVHSAYVQKGSSGGALLNLEDEVVGVTYAGVFDSDGNFIIGYAIPVSKVLEFINK